jgi:hypothetical protein
VHGCRPVLPAEQASIAGSRIGKGCRVANQSDRTIEAGYAVPDSVGIRLAARFREEQAGTEVGGRNKVLHSDCKSAGSI